ncbi:hypothetical protein I204_07284 [Kwoniella mangroviensis CBS 8886]|nr:hypothetical protein I204_07284 [Kwoniella mangroviensis CBS 8886]
MLLQIHSLLIVLPLISIPTYAYPSRRQSQVQEQDQEPEKSTGLYISSIRDGKCITTNDTVPVIGSELVMMDCEGAETWHVPNGEGLLGLDTVGLVWDSQGGEGDGVIVNASGTQTTSQLWKWSSDNRVSSSNGSICLQHTPGKPKIASCDSENVDQVWILRNTSQPQYFDDIAKQPDSNRDGYIHPKGRNDICLSAISNAEAYVGSGIAMTYCSGKGDGTSYLPVSTSESLFTWSLPTVNQKGHVKLSAQDLCLQTGLKAGNNNTEWTYIYGMGINLQECDDKKEGQDWIWDGESLKVAHGDSNQCLNILGGAGPVSMTNFLNLRPMQLWTCDSDDENSVSRSGPIIPL